MKFFRNMKIYTKLLGSYLILIVLPLCILGVMSYSNASSALTDQVSQSLESVLEKTVEQTDAFIDVCVRDTQELSGKPITQMAFYLTMYTRSMTSVENEYNQYIKERSYISHIQLYTMDGNEMLATMPPESYKKENVSNKIWFVGALKTDGVYITDMHFCHDGKTPVMTMSKLLKTTEGKDLGVIALVIRGSAVTSFTDELKAGKTGYGYILNKSGTAIAHPIQDHILKVNSLTIPAKGLVQVGKAMIAGGKGIGTYEYKGLKKHVFYAPYKRFGWSIAITMPDNELYANVAKLRTVIVIVASITVSVALAIGVFISRSVTRPIKKLRDGARIIGAGDLDHRVGTSTKDEVGQLSRAFDQMTENLRGTTTSIDNLNTEIIERKKAEDNMRTAKEQSEEANIKLKAAQDQLVDISRKAGMAEVAADVLHNVGNALNSVNVLSEVLAEKVRRSEVVNIARLSELIAKHKDNFSEFVANDEKGRGIPEYLCVVGAHLVKEQGVLLAKLSELKKHIEHIKEIVAMQQSYATVGGVNVLMNVEEIIEDAIQVNYQAFERHHIELHKDYAPMDQIEIDKHKVLQILINLLVNAKHALSASKNTDKKITVRSYERDDNVVIVVLDNGIGIDADAIGLIFKHGFTTKDDGHGFGLHSSANIAKQLGGSLSVHSDGPDTGAEFTLTIPLKGADINESVSEKQMV